LSKILIIDDCYLCPHSSDSRVFKRCKHPKRLKENDNFILPIDIKFIPDWCPLDEADERSGTES
jgi:hypothetical protein